MNVIETDYEPHIVSKSYRPHWATTATTTMEPDMPDVSVTSDLTAVRVLHNCLAAVVVGRTSRAFAHRLGRIEYFEATSEQVDFSDAHFIPRFLTSRALSRFGHVRGLARSPFAYEEDLVNWDAGVDFEPVRPSGTIEVTLRYAGRDVPLPFDDPWE